MYSVEELFKYITGFDDVDVNLLDGVHIAYNSLSSRFEIAPDDNRIVSYPFEYCFQKSNEGKSNCALDEDEFEVMWNCALENKPASVSIDKTTNFGNPIALKEADGSKEDVSPVVDKKVHFGTQLEVDVPKLGTSSIDKKS